MAEAGVKEEQSPGSLILLRFERERGLLKKTSTTKCYHTAWQFKPSIEATRFRRYHGSDSRHRGGKQVDADCVFDIASHNRSIVAGHAIGHDTQFS